MKTNIFSDPAIDLHISPFSIYVLIEGGENIKSREVLSKIEKRKTVTGNIFSVKAIRKDLVFGGESRRILKEALGNANIIAEILNPWNETPEYLYSRIDYESDKIDKTANQIRVFIKELCQKDIETIKKGKYSNILSTKNNLIEQLEALGEYLTKEIYKSECSSTFLKKSKEIKKAPKLSNFHNGLPGYSPEFISFKSIPVVAESGPYEVESEPEAGRITFSKSEIIRAMLDLGLDYEKLFDRIKRNNVKPIINTKDIILRIKQRENNERCPKFELEINKEKKIPITIGTKAGCIFYSSILLSMYAGKRFKRKDLTEVVENVNKKFKEKGTFIFSKDDYDSIPNLRQFDDLYKALLGKGNGTFVYWCIKEFSSRGLDTGASHIRSNIINTLRREDLLEIKDLLLIQKKTIYDQNNGSHNNVYWINLPIEQVDFPGYNWSDLKNGKKNNSLSSSLTSIQE